MRPSAPSRLRTLGVAVLATAALAAVPGTPALADTGGSASADLRAQVDQLNRDIARVGDELAVGAVAYEAAEQRLARLTQDQFAARDAAEASEAAAGESRAALADLARAAYKGGMPPMVTALLSGDPRTLSDLAYVQRSVDVVGLDRRTEERAAQVRRVSAGRALADSDAARRTAQRQRAALDAQLRALTARTDQLTGQLAATADRLAQAKAAEQVRAQAARQAASSRAAERRALLAAERAAAAAVPAPGSPAGSGPPLPGRPGAPAAGPDGCLPPSAHGEANGFLSPASLCPLDVGRGHRLRTDAARAFNALNRAHVAATGRPMCVTDSYRSYPEQVDVFKRKPGLAATPGRSQHGWGLALDLCGGVQVFGSAAHEWMRGNAGQHGWIHPAWARPGGSKPEAWHWEYVGG